MHNISPFVNIKFNLWDFLRKIPDFTKNRVFCSLIFSFLVCDKFECKNGIGFLVLENKNFCLTQVVGLVSKYVKPVIFGFRKSKFLCLESGGFQICPGLYCSGFKLFVIKLQIETTMILHQSLPHLKYHLEPNHY